MKKKLLLTILLLPIITMLAFSGIVSAASPEITSAEVYTGYLEDNDWIIVVSTNISTTPYYPYYNTADYWKIDLLNATNTTIATADVHFWNMSPSSIYLSASQASTYAWGSSDYKVQLVAKYNSSINSTHTLVAADWKAGSITILDGWVKGQAAAYEAYNKMTYTEIVPEYGLVLNTYGSPLFTTGVPMLETVRPKLFGYLATNISEWTTDTPTNAYQDSLDYTAALGTEISGLLDDTAAIVGMGSGQWVGGIICFIVFIALAVLGVLLGHFDAGIGLASVVLIFGTILGLVPMALTLLAAAILVILFAKNFFTIGA